MGHIGTIVKGADMRVRIIPLDCESVIVNILPKRVNIEKIAYKYDIANNISRSEGGLIWPARLPSHPVFSCCPLLPIAVHVSLLLL